MAKTYHPPAFCPEHGLFPATAIALAAGVSNITFRGMSQTCPRCGRPSEIIPGSYDSTSESLNVFIDPSISPQALAAVVQLVQRLQKGEVSPEDAKNEAEKISPKLGKLFDIGNWSDQAKATLYAAIIGAAAIVGAARFSASPNQTVNVNPVLVERVIDRRKNDLLSSSALNSNETIPLPTPRPKRPH